MPADSSPDATTVDHLISDPYNARIHGDRNIEMIASSLQEVGAARSIVVDEHGTILAGNATIVAAARAGMKHVRIIETDGTEIIAVRRSGLTDDQKQRLALYDNRTAELAEWDTSVLADIAESLDLTELWGTDELGELLEVVFDPAEEPLADPDEIPEIPEDPTTQPGDVWTLGRHRLICGDSTDPDVLGRLMGEDRAVCLWTDPPYGVNYVGKTAKAMTIANDSPGGLEVLLHKALSAAGDVMVPGAAFYIAHPAGPLSRVFAEVATNVGWSIRQGLVWVKDTFVLGRSDYHYRHEPILFGYLPGQGRRGRGGEGWYGDNAQDTIFEVPKPKVSDDHPTSKPVELVSMMLKNSSGPNSVVLDVFGGSGTTLIASELFGRDCRMVELSPQFCDVIVRRWEQITGQSAERHQMTG